eukprot:gnl/TRDRNA2_/TRDRNA2_175765_c0_seq1.p1 gnl/TRDRNA2_/TRDRNA2_175765_c0~~gnl/TRDRNA2_/TRDRNA2_175765_c0_seq1.p1  ORF type:complete len:355 (+),score=34.25 gnl/TRDRNA2_/TRDRNA2_175765_c0_seq1:140-1204(+)
MTWRAEVAVWLSLGIWIALNSFSAAGSEVFILVPLLGIVRWDLGVLFSLALLTLCFLLRCCYRCCPRFAICIVPLLLASKIVVSTIDVLPRFYPRGTYAAEHPATCGNCTGTVVPDALSSQACDKIAQATWDYRAVWKKISISGPLGYFIFGPTLNFDSAEAVERLRWWSAWFGFRDLLGYETFHVDSPGAESWRPKVQAGPIKLKFFADTLRQSLAAHLRVKPEQVIFGGDAAMEGIGSPGVQVWSPNLVWSMVVNMHIDDKYGPTCNPDIVPTAFIWPIQTPPGAGLLWWTRGEDEIFEHEILYNKGWLYTFPTNTPHAIRPFPYRDWDMHHRMAIQAFGAQCEDGNWYVWH